MRFETRELIDAMALDLIPSSATCEAFGIPDDDPTEHFGALQWAWRRELVSGEELDAAIGNGPALTEIASRSAGDDPDSLGFSNPYRCEFQCK